MQHIHMTIGSKERDSQRLEFLLEFCEQPITGGETSDEKYSLS